MGHARFARAGPGRFAAQVYGDLGDDAKSIDLLERALAIEEKHYGRTHLELAPTLVNLGNAHGDLGNADKRRSFLERALAIEQREYGPDHVECASTMMSLGVSYSEAGDHERARAFLEKALAIEKKAHGRFSQGSKRVRTSQLSRLISRPVSTRFSSFLDE